MLASRQETDAPLGDAALIHAIQEGLPLVERPYAAIGESIGMSESEVIARIERLLADGDIKRLGVVVRHHELGYDANAMVVWDLPDPWVDRIGQELGRLPFVTLSYRRPRRGPDWPYNLFTMIHGRDRESVMAQVEQIRGRLPLSGVNCAVLFSGRRFKQRGARYGSEPGVGRTQGPDREPGQSLGLVSRRVRLS